MARQTFTTTIRVYDPKAPGFRADRVITLDYDLQAIAQWLGGRANDSKTGKAMLMGGAIVAKTDTAIAGAKRTLSEFQQRGYLARIAGEAREYDPSPIDGDSGHNLMRKEFAEGWDIADRAFTF